MRVLPPWVGVYLWADFLLCGRNRLERRRAWQQQLAIGRRPLLCSSLHKGSAMQARIVPFFSFIFLSAASVHAASQLDPVVVTASRVPLAREQSGSSVSVITREELEKRGITQVFDALRLLPGVTVSRSGGGGGVSSIRLRGASQGQVRVMLDGVPLNDPASVDGSFDFNHLTVNGIERIEVVRGAQSALHGSDAMGGVINIITRKGADGTVSAAFAEGGSFHTLQAGAGRYDSVGKWDYGIEARHLQTQGFSHSSAGGENDAARNQSLNASIGYQALNDLEIQASGAYARLYSGFDPAALTDGEAYLEKQQFVGQVSADWQATETWRNRLSLQGADTRRSFDEPLGWYRHSTFGGMVLAAEYQSTAELTEGQTVVTGLRSERHEAEATVTQTGVSMTDLDAAIGQYALFGEYGVALGEHTDLTAGLRVDEHELFGSHRTQRATVSHRQPEWQMRLFSGIGTGFKAPTLFQLYSIYGEEGLSLEKGVFYEAGFEKALWGEKLQVSVTIHYTRYEDLIDFDAGLERYGNIAEAETYGIENAMLFELSEQWRVEGTYSWLRAEDRRTGAVLPRRPKHAGSLELVREWLNGAQTGGVLRMVSRQLDSNFSPDYNAGYAVVDVYGSYPVAESWELYGRIDNLLDRDYQEALHFNAAGISAYGGVRARW